MVDELGRFVVSANIDDMSDSARSALKRNVLDSLGCALAALDGEMATSVRDHAESMGTRGDATLIGGGRAGIDQAALVNSVLVRYVDLLDTYLTPGGLCHPADNFGAVLAVAERQRVSGQEFLLALALAYEIQCRFSAQVPVMARGLNHALQLSISIAAAVSRLLGLDAERTAHAIAIAAVDNVSLAAVHSEPVSNWKGISPGITAQRAVYTTELAERGITGPRGLFEGPNGLNRLFDQSIDLNLSDRSLVVVEQTHLKKYCSLIHGQPVIEAVLHLVSEHNLDYRIIAGVQLEVFQTAYDIAGGGAFGDKEVVRTKEQADYNLKYLASVALIDGRVGPEQLREDRITRDDVQALLRRVEVGPDDGLTAGYPQMTPVRVHIRLDNGQRLSREQVDFEGARSRPLSWQRVVEKFHWLSEPYTDATLRNDIVAVVGELDTQPLSMLTDLLGLVSAKPRRARTRRFV
ncbi:MmgE/PrpD family protein [Actinoallomurus sp. CA-150999]|uniref:MmgE/PrpD family protein n=1 Tax=Actinoallomurus sp. CA-150999 TaxID=3239887 RepID=UPI003D949508